MAKAAWAAPALLAGALAIHGSQSTPVTAQAAGSAPDVASQILRQPALSPDGKTLVFVYDGDLWTVPAEGGVARRLTVTADDDGSPCFSPDGRRLAFRSRRYGHDDVFVMPAEGGSAQRLTWADSSDEPQCWLPDGSGIIFASTRRENGRDLWVVRLDGGEPWPITSGGFRAGESDATISPDGKHIAYSTRGGSPLYRRGYYGTASSDIWLCDFDGLATSNHRRLTSSRAHEGSPVFASANELLYVSFEDGKTRSARAGRVAAMNLEGQPLPGWGGDTRLDAVELAVGGGKLAFSTGSYSGWHLHVSELGKRAPARITAPAIRIAADQRTGDYVLNRVSTVSEFQVSPDGKKLAFVAGADVFVMPAEENALPRQITDTVAREKDVTWAPDSSRIAFAGRNPMGPQICRHDVAGRQNIPALRSARGYRTASRPRFLDDKRLLCVADENRITLFDEPESIAVKGYFHGADLGAGELFDISPDRKWLLFSQPNENYDQQLWVANVDTGERIRLTSLFGDCGHGRFTADGKRVVFVSEEGGSSDVWVMDLAPPPVEFKEDKLDKLYKDPKKEEPRKEDPKKEEARKDPPPAPENLKDDGETPKAEPAKPAKAPPETRIVPEGLERRTRRVTTLEGDEYWPVCLEDGKAFYFIAMVQQQSNLWKLALDPDKGPDLKQITQSRSAKSALRASADEKTLWFLDGGSITSYQVAGGKLTSYGVSVEQRRDRVALRNEAFHEAAWVMGRYFYDEKHHGQPWDDLARRYSQALSATSTGDEYGALVNELLGELNSSHQGFTAVDARTDGLSEATGCLGVVFDATGLSKGEYIIAEVLKGGPCDIEGSPAPGTRLRAINGTLLTKGSNLARELQGQVGRRVLLALADGEAANAGRELAVKPTSRGAEYGLYYERWVEQQRALVHRLSEGKLGYVHIAQMDMESLASFKHELGDDIVGKQGVIVDVRFNGGGHTAVDVLEIMIKRPWLQRQERGLGEVSENAYRSVTLEKPSVLLINQDSFSNAEIMAEGYRRLKLGRIVGVDTAGGVIGTGGFTLVDGSRMRLPGTGAYTIDGENLENNGRKPDIFVENTPADAAEGRDRQTEAAVKALLEELEKK